jgi:hypothetical protein
MRSRASHEMCITSDTVDLGFLFAILTTMGVVVVNEVVVVAVVIHCVGLQHMQDDLAIESFQLTLADVQAVGQLIGETDIQTLLDLP